MIQPYTSEFYAPLPSTVTLFFRTFLPWQLVRFAWINAKMIRMIGKAHGGRVSPDAAAPSRGPAPLRSAPAMPNGR